MPFTLTMPKLSPTMEEGSIVKWHKKQGDFVQAGELLIEVATDKATIEFDALDEGYLRKILIQEGDDALVSQDIAIFSEDAKEDIEGYLREKAKQKQEKAHVEEAVPESVSPSKKEAPSIASPMSSVTFKPEQPLTQEAFPYLKSSKGRQSISPLAKKLADEQNLDLSSLKGSGPGGRIVQRDLEKAQKRSFVTFGSLQEPKDPPGAYQEEKLTPMRRVIGERLQAAKTFIPHYYVGMDMDVDALDVLRKDLKEVGVKVSFNDFVLRALALSLREHPEINSGFNSENNTVIRFKTVDISVAVSMENGLITPIVRHADYKNLGQISQEVKTLAKKAREGKLQDWEYKGGSCTLSNLGMFGVSDFKAVLNPPQAAILAVSGVQNVPVVKEGQLRPGKIMRCTLSCDHRVIDGSQAAVFLNTLKNLLEKPAILCL